MKVYAPVIPKHYVYAVVDKRTTPPTLLSVENTRQGGNWFKSHAVDDEDKAFTRVVRGKLVLFEK